jgi:hypothetical protein
VQVVRKESSHSIPFFPPIQFLRTCIVL